MSDTITVHVRKKPDIQGESWYCRLTPVTRKHKTVPATFVEIANLEQQLVRVQQENQHLTTLCVWDGSTEELHSLNCMIQGTFDFCRLNDFCFEHATDKPKDIMEALDDLFSEFNDESDSGEYLGEIHYLKTKLKPLVLEKP